MKKFKTKKRINNRDILLIGIGLLTLIFILVYDRLISPRIKDIAESKLNEITTLYIKKDIIPKNKDLNKLIIINKNKNDEIVYIDIDHDYANMIMNEVVTNIQTNIDNISKDNNKEIKSYNNNLYIELPLGIYRTDSLLNNFGPKIPVKLSFYEYVIGNIDTQIKEYGINNVMMKVYLEIELTQKMIIPYKEKITKSTFKIILGTKLINGKVPDIYGGIMSNKYQLS